MATPKDEPTPQEMKLEDLEWPDAPPADEPNDGTAGADGAGGSGSSEPAQAAPPPEWFDRTTRTVDDKGNVNVDLTGLINDVKTPWTPGGSKRDSDGDGLTDEYERMHNTDPNSADTDKDGFSDAVEDEWGMGTGSIWSPPNATADDVDGDGVPNLKEIQQDTSPVFDGYAAGGKGTDAVEGAKHYYDGHKTGDPIGDAWLRQEYNVPATPAEQQALDDAIADQLFSDNPLTRLRAEDALAGFDPAKVPQRARDEADQFIKDATTKAVDDALSSNDPSKIAGALRFGQLSGGLSESQTGRLEGAFTNLLNPGGTGPGTGPATGPGTGTGMRQGTDTSAGAGSGTGGATDPGRGSGDGMGPGTDPFGGRDPGDRGGAGSGDAGSGAAASTPPSSPAGGAAPPASSTPDWMGAADSLTAGSADDSSQGVGSMGSRGDGGGSSLPGGIGSLGTKNEGIGNSSSPTGKQATGGGAQSDPLVDAEDFDAVEIPAGNPASWPYITGQSAGPSAGSDTGADSGSDGSNPGAGTTDDGSDAGNDEPADDTGDSDLPDDGNSGEATAYVDPDADSTMGGIAFRTPIRGGGFTDFGRDLPTIDLTGVTPVDPNDTGGIEHVEPEADSTMGGFVFRTPVAGGGFTDFGRDLPTIDLTGVTPTNPNDGTDAFGGGDDGFALDQGAMDVPLDGPDGPGAAGMFDGDGPPFP